MVIKKRTISHKKYVISVSVLIVAAITGVLLYLFLISSGYSTRVVGGLPIRGSSSMTSHNGDLYVLRTSGDLWRIDESDPQNSVLIGGSSLLEYAIMTSHNGGLYAISDRRLWQIDLNDIENGNTVVGDLPDQLSQPKAMTSHNGVLYAVSSDEELWKVNASNPYNKSTRIGDLPDEISWPVDMASHNGDLYLTDTDEILHRIDTNDPENGNTFARYLPEYILNARAMASHHGVLYIIDHRTGGRENNLSAINLKDLEKDITFIEGDNIGRLQVYASSMASNNGDLYITEPADHGLIGQFLKIDLGNVVNSASLGPVGYGIIASHGGVLYASDLWGEELLEIDPNNPGDSTVIARDFSGNSLYKKDIALYGMTSHDGVLYMVGEKIDNNIPQLLRIDLDNPENNSIFVVGLPDQISFPRDIVSLDGVLYILDGHDSDLWKINLDDPKNGSALVGNLPGYSALAIASLGGVLYLADSGNLWKINLDD